MRSCCSYSSPSDKSAFHAIKMSVSTFRMCVRLMVLLFIFQIISKEQLLCYKRSAAFDSLLFSLVMHLVVHFVSCDYGLALASCSILMMID